MLAAMRVFWGYPKRPQGIRLLARGEAAFLAAAADVIFPEGGPLPPSGSEAGVPRYLDGYLRLLPTTQRRLIRMLFFLLEHGTIIFPADGRGGRRRFTRLTLHGQVAYMRSWHAGRYGWQRLVFTAFRAILGTAYLGDGQVLGHLGLGPKRFSTPVIEADLLWPRIGRPPSQISVTRHDLTPIPNTIPLIPSGPTEPGYEVPQ